MSSHTHGPWCWRDGALADGEPVRDLVGEDGFSLMENAVFVWSARLNEANERLIAAAPDLLDALVDAHDALGELLSNPFLATDWDGLWDVTGNANWYGLKERIDAALAKARPQENDLGD